MSGVQIIMRLKKLTTKGYPMKLSEITSEHINEKVSIDLRFGTFVGIVAWVNREEFLRFNSDKYLHEEFGRNVTGVYIPYEGQKDYYQKVISVEVGFYGDSSKKTEVKENCDIAEENPQLEDYLRKYNR